jgi:hypothetical protein
MRPAAIFPARNRPATAKSERQERANKAPDAEADQTARLNAVQVRRATESAAVASAATPPLIDLAEIEPSRADAIDAPIQATDKSPPPARNGEDVPLSPSLTPEHTAQDVERPIDENTPAAAAISPPISEPTIASMSPEERAKAGADRRLREWCKAQRRRCTFPAPGS